MTIQNQRGQGLIEYLIIVALMAVATISVMSVMGSSMTRRFANIAKIIQGEQDDIQKVQVTETSYKKKDLGDFMNGAVMRQPRGQGQNGSGPSQGGWGQGNGEGGDE